jgi:transposase
MRRKIVVPNERTTARNARIRALYEQGDSIHQVAQVVGVHPTTAWRVLARAGAVRPRGWKQRQEQLAATE